MDVMLVGKRRAKERAPERPQGRPVALSHARRLTLEQLLAHPCLAGHEVVAGHSALTDPVREVAVLDPDDLGHLRAGQILLTNAYSLLGSNFGHLMAAFHRQGAVALGVKLSGFWSELPAQLVRAANSYGVLLLTVPDGPFNEMINPLLSRIAERHVIELQQAARLHRDLTSAALQDGGDPQAVLELLDRSIDCRVAVFAGRHDIVWRTGPAELWPTEALEAAARRRRDGFVTMGGRPSVVVPIPGTASPRCLLCAIDVVPRDEFARAAIGHAAVVIGMLRVERRHIGEVHQRFARQLLEDLAIGRLPDRDDVRARAAWVGWPLDSPYVVVAGLSARARTTDQGDGVASFEAVFREAGPRLHGSVMSLWSLGTWGRYSAAVVHLREPQDAPRITAALRTSSHSSRDSSKAPSPRLGVSGVWTDPTDLQHAFGEAALAASAPLEGPVRTPVRGIHELGPVRLLARSQDQQALDLCAVDVLGPIADDSPWAVELLGTLTSLVAHSMSLRATAEDQHFHYNTIRNRLTRIRKHLGPALDDPSDRLSISLAVAAMQLRELRFEFNHDSAAQTHHSI